MHRNAWLTRCEKVGETARRTPEGSGPGGEGPMPPNKKGPSRPLGSGNALHERNGLSSHGLHRSTFGDGELNCRVRHGTG